MTIQPLAPIAVSPAQAVELTGLSIATLYRLIKGGQLPVSKVGSRTLIRTSNLERLLNEGER